ncbi:cob(I)yrinic acid a,c-diamide adenosyltransferase [Lachnospiraceae bacterium ZAX-1]
MNKKNTGGLIHIYEGDGKGKTSAGVGLSVRCAGSGQRVIYTQFLKDNLSSELNVLKQIENIHLIPCEKSFGFTFAMTPQQKEEATQYYTDHLKKVIETAIKEQCRLIVLDEIIASYNLNMIKQEDLISFLKNKPQEMEVVMTGRDPAEELVELADYVSRIVKVKHPFDQGIPARKGIEN